MGKVAIGIWGPLLFVGLVACSNTTGQDEARRGQWQNVLTEGQTATVRETFPDYQPPRVNPSVPTSDPSRLTGSVFEPARFFHTPTPRGYRQLPSGARVENNGYECPANLSKKTGTHFGFQGNAQQFSLQARTIDPRNGLRARMGLPQLSAHNSPLILADYGQPCANLSEIQDIISKTKEALAAEFPEIALLSEADLQTTVEPTIFWVRNSNFGPTWAGGETSRNGSQFGIRVIIFYIANSDLRIADWREFLVWELTNYYALRIGSPDLAF